MQVDMFELYLRKPVLEHMRIENVSVVTILDGYLRIAALYPQNLVAPGPNVNNLVCFYFGAECESLDF